MTYFVVHKGIHSASGMLCGVEDSTTGTNSTEERKCQVDILKRKAYLCIINTTQAE